MKYETIHGVTFTGHALARMRSRDIPLRAALLALRLCRPRWELGDRWLYRVTEEHGTNPALKPWVGVCVVWDAADQVVVTVYWDKPEMRPLARRHKVYVRRGPKRGWVYQPAAKTGGGR